MNYKIYIYIYECLLVLCKCKTFYERHIYKWQHSKSYIMPQTTDLFYHTSFFAKSNMLLSFSPHFFANIEGAYTPT